MRARHTRRWGRAAGLVLALAAGGCYEGYDPFDRAVLEAIMRDRGDAEGVDRSGVYGGDFEVLECGCSEIDEDYDVSLCSSIDRAQTLGLPLVIELEVVQAEGSVRLRALGLDGGFFGDQAPLLPTYYGSLDADGRLTAASVLVADALLVQGEVLGRLDGTLVAEDGGWRLEAGFEQRYAVDLYPDASAIGVADLGPGEADALAVDCQERLTLDLRWRGPPGSDP